MTAKRRAFHASDLRRVASAESFQIKGEPPLRIGDLVVLNSGGPVCLVVDVNDGLVDVEWRRPDGSVEEMTANNVCFHRKRDLTGAA